MLHFEKVCTPNSETQNEALCADFESKYNEYLNKNISGNAHNELVDSYICKLKCNKAAGFDDIQTEHILQSSCLFNGIFRVPTSWSEKNSRTFKDFLQCFQEPILYNV